MCTFRTKLESLISSAYGSSYIVARGISGRVSPCSCYSVLTQVVPAECVSCLTIHIEVIIRPQATNTGSVWCRNTGNISCPKRLHLLFIDCHHEDPLVRSLDGCFNGQECRDTIQHDIKIPSSQALTKKLSRRKACYSVRQLIDLQV